MALRHRSGRALRGFTAMEALVAAAILAVITAAVSGALMAGRQQSRLAEDTVYASLLARGLMDEVTRLPMDTSGGGSFGPNGSEVRNTYNDADDYHGYTDGPNTITDIAGNKLPAEYQYYTRSVSISAATYTPANWGKTLNALLVTVTVSRDGKELITLKRLVCE